MKKHLSCIDFLIGGDAQSCFVVAWLSVSNDRWQGIDGNLILECTLEV